METQVTYGNEPKKMAIQVVLPEAIIDALDNYAFAHHLTRGEAVTEALEAYLKEKVAP